MRRSVRWTLFASVITALALFVAACGGSDDDNGSTGGGSSATAGGTEVKAGKPGGTLTYLAAGDVDYLDPGQTTTRSATWSSTPSTARCTRSSPTTPSSRCRTSPTGRPADLRGQQDDHRPHQDGHQVRAAGRTARSRRRTSSTRSSARSPRRSPAATRAPTSARHRRHAGQAQQRRRQADLGHRDAGRHHDRSSSSRPPSAPLVSQALVMPITVPVPEEYAEKFDAKYPVRRTTSTSPSPARTWSRTTPDGQAHRPRSRASRSSIVRNPNWDKDDGLPSRLPRRDHDRGGQRRPGDGLAPHAERRRTPCAATPARRRPRSSSRRCTQNKDQVAVRAVGRHALHRAQHDTVKPFDNINVRKAIIAGFDRNALRLTRGGEVLGDIANGWIPPGIPGFEEAGGLKQNTDLDYLQNPTGDPAVCQEVHAAPPRRTRACRSTPTASGPAARRSSPSPRTPIRARRPPRSSRARSRSSGFKLNFRIVPQDTLYTKFCGVPEGEVAICPNVGWFKDFADPQSMLDADVQRRRTSSTQGNVNWPQLDVPGDQRRDEGRRGRRPSAPERNKAWAEIDQHDRRAGPGDPVHLGQDGPGGSKDVEGVDQRRTTPAHDLSFTSLK